MSLNTILLPKRIIADLYKNNLVELETTAPVLKSEKLESQFKFLGENKKKILIAVKYPDVVYLPDDQLGFLANLLRACKLDLGDVAVLNFKLFSGKDFSNILFYFEPKTICLFGLSPEELGLPLLFPPFQVQVFKETVYLYSPALEKIEQDKILKSKLWVCFKKIFGL